MIGPGGHRAEGAKSPVTVLLVDDSPVALAILKRILTASPDITVVGTARSGREAMELIPKLQPAVVCTDFHMPDMDGLELTRQILARHPRPVLVVSASTQPEDRDNIRKLLDAGAIDVLPKPTVGIDAEYEKMAADLVRKIRVLSGVYVFRRGGASAADGAGLPGAAMRDARVVVIGASTGGPQAFQEILSQLPAGFPVPVLCVQHIAQGFLDGFVAWLRNHTRLKIEIARIGEKPMPGIIYFPAEGNHLELGSQGQFILSGKPPVNGHKPAITVAMLSAVEHYGAATVGVLLSGMGADGVEGMRAIVEAGGITFAQNQESCTVYGMSAQAVKAGAARYELDPAGIARKLLEISASYRES